MTRKFKTVDYEAALELRITIGACLAPHHLARFVVGIVEQLDMSRIHNQYGKHEDEPYDPQVLLRLLFRHHKLQTVPKRVTHVESFKP